MAIAILQYDVLRKLFGRTTPTLPIFGDFRDQALVKHCKVLYSRLPDVVGRLLQWRGI
jgi:hypothetical protein